MERVERSSVMTLDQELSALLANGRCEYIGQNVHKCACGHMYDATEENSHIHECPYIPMRSMLTDAEIYFAFLAGRIKDGIRQGRLRR